jgi:hypothetical protein
MNQNNNKKPLSKGFIYSMFILKFVAGLALIYWTIYMTFQSDVGQDDDNAFLSTYHEIDRDYNTMIKQNIDFEDKYNVKFVFNDTTIIGLTHKDIYLSQRVIQKRKIRKNIVKVGENKFGIYIQDKDGNKIKDKKVKILITKNTNHLEDIKLNYKNEDTKEFKIHSIGYWNITGIIEVDKYKGFFYIKTNAKKE